MNSYSTSCLPLWLLRTWRRGDDKHWRRSKHTGYICAEAPLWHIGCWPLSLSCSYLCDVVSMVGYVLMMPGIAVWISGMQGWNWNSEVRAVCAQPRFVSMLDFAEFLDYAHFWLSVNSDSYRGPWRQARGTPVGSGLPKSVLHSVLLLRVRSLYASSTSRLIWVSMIFSVSAACC